MPELPEVENLRRSILPHLVGQVFERATLHRRDVLVAPGDPVGGFARQPTTSGAPPVRPRRIGAIDLLATCRVLDVHRRGKQLAIIAQPTTGAPRALGVQLGMTGTLRVLASREHAPTDHVHATWHLSDARMLFHDPRRFGGLRVFPTLEHLNEHWSTLGPDALTITPATLAQRLAHSRRAIKASLLDQEVLAGVGNIYADEALFDAQIHPERSSQSLAGNEIERLARAIASILSAAVESGGSTLRNYTDALGQPGDFQLQHRAYDRGGQPCPRCGFTLANRLIAQRTTTWCPKCQPA